MKKQTFQFHKLNDLRFKNNTNALYRIEIHSTEIRSIPLRSTLHLEKFVIDQRRSVNGP